MKQRFQRCRHQRCDPQRVLRGDVVMIGINEMMINVNRTQLFDTLPL